MTDHDELAKQPSTPEELLALHKVLRSDPQRYLRIVNGWLEDDPKDVDAHFSRHLGWMKIGEPLRALEDLNKMVEIGSEPDAMFLMSRGMVYRHIGEYENAREDFDRADALDPEKWEKDIVFGLLFQADTYARLGDELGALAACARLPDDFWTPGIEGTPGGSKSDVAEKLRNTARTARRR
jgi:tetratricopeptide (TPR) repeat protein